jgi:hypothetical protein
MSSLTRVIRVHRIVMREEQEQEGAERKIQFKSTGVVRRSEKEIT